jgi:hypothetical protein
MEYGRAIIVDSLTSVELGWSQPVIYDREIGLRLLYQDPDSGAEHYLIRYPAGLRALARSSRRSVFGTVRSATSRTRSPTRPCSVHTKARW